MGQPVGDTPDAEKPDGEECDSRVRRERQQRQGPCADPGEVERDEEALRPRDEPEELGKALVEPRHELFAEVEALE